MHRTSVSDRVWSKSLVRMPDSVSRRLAMVASANRLRMCASGASLAQRSCLAIGVESVVSSSSWIRAWKSGKPLKPSLRTMRTTVGVDTPACWAMVVIEPRADIG